MPSRHQPLTPPWVVWSDLMIFDHGHEVRIVKRDGEPWFVAADVCRALGMNTDKGTFQWLTALNAGEKNTHNLPMGIRRGNPNVTIISESGMYKLVLRSDKPQALLLHDWVTGDVLPTIRKTGLDILPGDRQS